MPQVASTRCRVLIVAPSGARFHFREEAYAPHLMGVEVQKDLNQACGSFTLHFAPVRDSEGRRWDEIIPRRSLVYIDMERTGDPALPDPTSDPTVMVGLTEDHGMAESWTEAQPRRDVRISGREISGVLLDAHLVYSQALSAQPEFGTLTIRSMLGVQQLALAWNPKLAKGSEDPRETIERILDYFLFIGGETLEPADTPGLQQPIMQLDLPDITLSDLLDKNRAQWKLFDERAQVQIAFNTVDAGSIWNYLHL